MLKFYLIAYFNLKNNTIMSEMLLFSHKVQKLLN